MISICIAVKGRLEHLKQTLPIALAEARSSHTSYEFVILDWDCPDGTANWVSELNVKFPGELRLFQVPNQPYWNCPLTRNITHALAQGSILVNLDADDIFRGKTCNLFDWLVTVEPHDLLLASYYNTKLNKKMPGNMGRVAVSAAIYKAVGGYSVAAPHLPGGTKARLSFHDKDFVRKAAAVRGSPPTYWPPCSAAFIKHDNATRLKYTDLPDEKSLFRAWCNSIDSIAADKLLPVEDGLSWLEFDVTQIK